MSKNRKKVCATLNCIEHFLILAFKITEIYFNFFLWLFDWYSYRSYELCNWIKNLCNSRRNEKYKSIIKKNKKQHDKIVFLAKSKLNGIEVLIFKALIDSVISHDEFLRL